MAAPRDAAVLSALVKLETARHRLHDALREAAFSLSSAQREEESTRGCFVSFDAVPTEPGSLEALAFLFPNSATTSGSDAKEAGGDQSDATSRVCSSSSSSSSGVWDIVQIEGQKRSKQKAPPAVSQRLSPAPNSTEEEALPPPDPIYYFSENPSSALRECQEAYRHVLRCIVETANAQQHALAAAACMPNECVDE
ncbi:hypothetical protein JKF63_06686 [Porcisia hertigi]|uniref:Uncharacterized protein n=1 Tax=Porcisia hertigi TaxID=2761500 RepID=A0A836LEK9_9TRYP|nr:hypothetical protein JKF63_06686 [Porcisia hertigi]